MVVEKLKKICEVKENYDLVSYNTFKLHSKCKALVIAITEKELLNVCEILFNSNEKYFILGNGSNVILPSYFDGYIIKYCNNLYEINGNILKASSGCMLNRVASEMSTKCYTGWEWATGIPGTLGGSIVGNAGAYKSSISDLLIKATVYDGKKIYEMTNEDFKYEYRNSSLKGKRNIMILSAEFKLIKGNNKEIRDLIFDRTKRRIETQDLKNPSNGSVFRNPEGQSAGKLIDDLGLIGLIVNDAMVSEIHANFIINKGQATSKDIVELINIVKSKVKEHYDIELHLEQEIIN